ncbi:hypothetical protein [Streptomyces platensis]|uniref:hypothetical protein n=1 Tax=Streptomyces platensis TaxID=58346 RepID=UPI0036C17778
MCDIGPGATLIVGLHGVLERHPWIDRVSAESRLDEDVYGGPRAVRLGDPRAVPARSLDVVPAVSRSG